MCRSSYLIDIFASPVCVQTSKHHWLVSLNEREGVQTFLFLFAFFFFVSSSKIKMLLIKFPRLSPARPVT